MADPWYQDGLRFTCTRCGNCCTGAPGYVWVTPAELEALAAHLGEPVETVRAVYTWEEQGRRSLRVLSHAPESGPSISPGTGRTWRDKRPRAGRRLTFFASMTPSA